VPHSCMYMQIQPLVRVIRERRVSALHASATGAAVDPVLGPSVKLHVGIFLYCACYA
jgi:hypothetical protein